MKKALSILLLATALIFTLSACSVGEIEIEDYEWTLRRALHGENDRVVVDATDEADTAHPDARVVDITLTASNGRITITDITNDRIYEGTYTVEGKNPAGTDYRVTIDGKTGYATVAMTTYADGSEEPTLPINIGGYSLYFYAEQAISD